VDSAPWDTTEAAASAVAGPVTLVAASRATAALVRRPLWAILAGLLPLVVVPAVAPWGVTRL